MMKFIVILLLPILNVIANDYPNATGLDSDQVISNIDGKKQPYLPHDRVLPHLKIDNDKLKQKVTEAKEMISGKSDEQLSSNETTDIENSDEFTEEEEIQPPPKRSQKTKRPSPPPPQIIPMASTTPPAPLYRDTADGVRIFSQNIRYVQTLATPTVSLPSGATAMASLLAGIEVSATESRKTYAQLDYAFLGPNETVVELKGCIVWFSITANYTTERLYGETTTLSCRAPNGKTFTVPIRGHLIDHKDQYIGAKGELLARGKILASAMMFMRDATGEFGKALAAAQIKTEITEGGDKYSGQKAENVTGSQTKYVIGKSSGSAVANFLNWWVDFYMGLSPTVAMGPGKKIFLAIEDEVQIPKIFFQNEISSTELNQEQRRLNTIGGSSEPKEE